MFQTLLSIAWLLIDFVLDAVLTKEIVKECPGVENILKCNPSCSYRLETANNRQGCLVSYSTGTDVKLFYAHKSTGIYMLFGSGIGFFLLLKLSP